MWGEMSLAGYRDSMTRWYTADGRSRRYWTIYAVTAFVTSGLFTGTALSHRAVDDRGWMWALGVTWFCAGVSFVVRARHSPSKRAEEDQPLSTPPPSE